MLGVWLEEDLMEELLVVGVSLEEVKEYLLEEWWLDKE